jgi:mRNA interferase MazF
MTPQRGDILLVRFPFSSGAGSKIRPALVVQSDVNNQRLSNIIVVATTTHRSHQPTQMLIELSTPEGKQSGLVKDSVVTCENIVTLDHSRIHAKIGSIPSSAMTRVNDCLKAALEIP